MNHKLNKFAFSILIRHAAGSILVFTSLFLVSQSSGQSRATAKVKAKDTAVKMTREEKLVRVTYAKLSFAAQMSILWHAVSQQNGWPGLENQFELNNALNSQIRFDLTDFKVGNLSDIGDRSWTSLIEGPVDVIGVNPQTIPFSITNGHKERKLPISYVEVFWKKKSDPPSEYLESEHKLPTVREVLLDMHGPASGKWSRYASFSVVAAFRQRTVSYRASFLFNTSSTEVLPLDYALGMGPGSVIHVPMYPSALVDSAYREIPFVQGWLIANELKGCKEFKEPEVCCDPTTGQCGIASEDIQRSMAIPIDPEERSILDTRLNHTPKDR
jgi:hypothetical protein